MSVIDLVTGLACGGVIGALCGYMIGYVYATNRAQKVMDEMKCNQPPLEPQEHARKPIRNMWGSF